MSLHAPITDDLTLGDMLRIESTSEDIAIAAEKLERIDRALRTLGTGEEQVLHLYCGLYDGDACTQEKIARLLGFTNARIWQIKRTGLQKMRLLLAELEC